jgi:hypothetical protein
MEMSISLTVAEAMPEDIGERIARIHGETMSQLGIKTGDVIEIIGRKKASAIAYPSEDKDCTIIRLDTYVRKSAGTAVGEQVSVVKVERINDAFEVTLSAENIQADKIDQEIINKVKNRFLNTPFMEGDFLMMPLPDKTFIFQVVKTKPEGVVRIIEETRLQVVGPPVISGLNDQEIRAIISKYVGTRTKGKLTGELDERAFHLAFPEEGKFVLYAKDLEALKKLISESDVKMLDEYPMINGMVVFGKREKIFGIVLNDLVKEFDIIRKVKAVDVR